MNSDDLHEQETMVNLPDSGSDSIGSSSGVGKPAGEAGSERLGKYSLLKVLGEGAMGAVYLAWDTELERHVAIKIPKFHSDKDPQLLLDRFQREARSAAALTHPGICPIFEFGEIGGQFFLAMAYIEGRALEEYMARPDPIVPKQAATLIRRVAMALADAHDAGVMHRDLKPGNIMVNREARPVVMDFGLARQGKDTRLTQTGAFLGTPAYASPEQIKNASNDVDYRTDIYSLGVILYEMLAKRLPFVSNTVMGMVGEILTTDPDSPTVHRAEACPRLCRIALKAMRRDRATRYQSMHELAEDLAKYLESLDGTASQPLQASRTGRAESVESEAQTEVVPKLATEQPTSGAGRHQSDTSDRTKRSTSKSKRSSRTSRTGKHVSADDRSKQGQGLQATKRSSAGSRDIGSSVRLPAKRKSAVRKSRSEKSKRKWSRGSIAQMACFLVLAISSIAGAIFGVAYLLEPGVGKVRFTIVGEPPGLEVQIDGKPVDRDWLPIGLDLPAGRHTVTATAIGFETVRNEFVVEPNDEQLLTLTFELPEPVSSAEPREAAPPDVIVAAQEAAPTSTHATSNAVDGDGPKSESQSSAPPTDDPGLLAMVGQTARWRWGKATPITSLNADKIAATPHLSADGLELFFGGSGGRDNSGGVDILRSKRRSFDAAWSKPVSLGPRVCDQSSDAQPWLSPDGTILVFASNRSGADDLYRTTRPKRGDTRWSTPAKALNLKVQASNPVFDAGGRVLFFQSFQPRAIEAHSHFRNMVTFNKQSWTRPEVSEEVIQGVEVQGVEGTDWYVAQCLPEGLLVGDSNGKISVHFGNSLGKWRTPNRAKLPTMYQPSYSSAAREIIFQRDADDGGIDLWSVKLEKVLTD